MSYIDLHEFHTSSTLIRKSLMPVIFPPAILRPEMAAPILWAPGIFSSFCRKTPMPIKLLVLGGGGVGFEGGGVEVPIMFLWAWGFFRFKGMCNICK